MQMQIHQPPNPLSCPHTHAGKTPRQSKEGSKCTSIERSNSIRSSSKLSNGRKQQPQQCSQ